MPDALAERAVPRFSFDNSYARLPERFFARQPPVPVAAPALLRLNEALARELGLDPAMLASPDGVAMLAGNRVPEGAAPLAMAYAGHQFGNFVPQLGDGRAILLGEVIDRAGVRRDIQLKGAGRTPFSRGGDGRAALGPALREYIVSEAMAGLGIATTRALAVVTTGERILRDGPQPGAVVTRVARSHVRVGTFQFFLARGDAEAVRLLADYVIARHYPDAAGAANPYRALLDAVIAGTARLVASWQLVGFIHGVMNTDNMSIAGETIDYGPCAFMDRFDFSTVYSAIDHAGRYAYGNQPHIAHWNMARLAEALLPLLDAEQDAGLASAYAALDAFATHFGEAWLAGLRRKLGLSQPDPEDAALAQALLDRMAANHADFTLTFRRLGDAAGTPQSEAGTVPSDDGPVRGLFDDPQAFDQWAVTWRQRLAREGGPTAARRAAMHAANPAFIARNHQVQAVLSAAQDDADLAPLEALLAVLATPYDDQPGLQSYAEPPTPEQVVHRTFCGT